MNEDKSVRYHRLKRRAAVASLVVSALLPVALLSTGATLVLRDAAVALGGAEPLAVVGIYGLVFVLLHEMLTLPLVFYSSHRLERRYGLSSEASAGWWRDHLKGLALSAVIGISALQFVYWTLRTWPTWWWLISAAAAMLFMAVMARVFPTLLLPWFYRFTPLDRPELRERLEALSEKAGVKVLGVFEWGLGAKTRRANAALVGLGGSRRILLSDTLLADYSDDEIEVILAHEMAHHVHGDIFKGLLLESALLVAAFGAAALALARWAAPLGLASPADVAGLPLLVLVAGGTMVAASPLVNAFSRRNEHRADAFALALTGRPGAFVSAMKRLAGQNLAEPDPSRLVLWLFHSHPPIAARIARAQGRSG